MSQSGDELNLRGSHIQDSLFPWLREAVGGLTAQYDRIVLLLHMLGLATHVAAPPRAHGRSFESGDARSHVRLWRALHLTACDFVIRVVRTPCISTH